MTADQVVSGASNVLIGILAARMLNVEDFGRFGVVLLVYTLLIWVTRGFVSDLLLVNLDDAAGRPGDALGVVVVIAGCLALLLASIGVVIGLWDANLGSGILILAACLPLLAVQDVGRFLGFATQRVGRALTLDTLWLAVMVAAVVVLGFVGVHDLSLLVAAWGGAGAVSALLVFRWYSVRSIRLRSSWLADTWELGWRYLVSYGSMQVVSLGVVSEVGEIGGAIALGAVQGSILVVRPFTTVQVAVMTIYMSEAARAIGSRTRIIRQALFGSVLMAAVASLNTVILLVLPFGVGHLLLGADWRYVKPLILPTGLDIVAIGLMTGPSAALNGLKAMREVMRVVMVTPVITLVCAGVGTALDGAVGCLWLMGIGQMAITAGYWFAFVLALRRGAAETVPAETLRC